jgi:hypothetical protein
MANDLFVDQLTAKYGCPQGQKDIPRRLKDYAMAHVRTISREYEWQLGKWETYYSQVADQHLAAHDRFKAAFAKIREEQQEERQLAMLALSFVGSPALSWIASAVQYKLYPRFATKSECVTQWVLPGGKRAVGSDRKPSIKPQTIWRSKYSEVVARSLGDNVGKPTGLALDKVFSRVLPKNVRQPTIRRWSCNVTSSMETLRPSRRVWKTHCARKKAVSSPNSLCCTKISIIMTILGSSSARGE